MSNFGGLDEITTELVTRPGHEKVRTLVHILLTRGLRARSSDIDFERQVPEVRGRIDALLGRTVFEIKSDLRRERADADSQLLRYLPEREQETKQRYVGIATDGAEFYAAMESGGELLVLGTQQNNALKPSN